MVLMMFKVVMFIFLIAAVVRYIKAKRVRKRRSDYMFKGYSFRQKMACLLLCLFEIFATVMTAYIISEIIWNDDLVPKDGFVIAGYISMTTLEYTIMILIMHIYRRQANQLLLYK